MWQAIVEAFAQLGVFATGVLALGWLSRSLVTHFMSKDIEKFKIELMAQSDVAIERMRSDLTKHALEHEVTYRRVDAKVAEHLAEIYYRLVTFYDSVCSYVHPFEWGGEPRKAEKLEITRKASEEFRTYFRRHRVYVPDSLHSRVSEFNDKLVDIATKFAAGLERQSRGDYEKDHWSEGFRAIKDEASPLFTAIVADVQKRLGVADSEDGEAPTETRN